MNGWLETLMYGDTNQAVAPVTILFSLLLAFVLGQVSGWVYLWTHVSPSYSRSYVASLVVMPVIVAVMMIMVAGSVALAFGLLAVFAVVRFRNVLKDTRDTTFILWVIVEGMSVGTGRFTTAILGSLVVAAVLIYLRVTEFGSRLDYDAVLAVELQDGDTVTDQLTEVLRRYTLGWSLAGQRSVSETGSTFNYRLSLRDPTRTADLQGELAGVDGLRLISLYTCGDESEV